MTRALGCGFVVDIVINPKHWCFARVDTRYIALLSIVPVHLRDPGLSLNNFKIKLKTHFFS